MEVPDFVLVTKGDLGAPARRAAADVRSALSLAAGAAALPGIAIVSARTGEGVAAALELILAAADLGGDAGRFAARRREQGRVWIELRLLELFGRVGQAALAPRLINQDSPFAAVSDVVNWARTAVHEILKEL